MDKYILWGINMMKSYSATKRMMYYNKNAPQKYAKWNKPDIKGHSHELSRINTYIEIDRLAGVKGCRIGNGGGTA